MDVSGIDLVLLAVVASGGAIIACIAGFGLATVLTPVLLLFIGIREAVLLVAVIHLGNGLFRFWMFRRHVDLAVVRRFGAFCVAGALGGALLHRHFHDPALKIILGFILVLLGGMELLPLKRRLRIPRRYDQAGGLLSGTLGGVIGNQGAIRSAYLLNYDLPKEAFVGTGAILACIIDVVRVPVYLWGELSILREGVLVIPICLGAAWLGTFAGKRIVHKMAEKVFRTIVAVLILVLGGLLIGGIV
jgi:uncharacterized membrane protein YfcA